MLKRGDIVIYTFPETPEARGSLGVVIRGEYEDLTATNTNRAVDIHWITAHKVLLDLKVNSYNICCVEKIGVLPEENS